MTDYSLAVTSSAAKELDALDDGVFERIDPRIRSLGREPRPTGCKKLKGKKGLWRIRVGDYRVVYSVDDSERVVTILRVAHRSRAYDA